MKVNVLLFKLPDLVDDLLVGFVPVLQPAGHMAAFGIMMGPMHDSALCVPLEFTIEGDGIAFSQR